MEGMSLYKEYWKGPVTLLCEPSDRVSDNLDNCEVDLSRAPFQLISTTLRRNSHRTAFSPPSLMLAAIQFTHCSQWARSMGIPCVYVTEYSLRTRLEIMREERPPVVRRAWRSWYERRLEIAQRKALALADGVQCNGVPTYRDYQSLTRRPMLFFDTRVEESQLATPAKIHHRWTRFARDGKLRLVFSGRLNRMKGVQQLPVVAAHLKRLGVRFELFICGDGELMPDLRASVAQLGLSDCVTLRGALEFKSELVPFVTGETDLFVCCHPQGDPSCTYLETMGCGVPLVGYSNEAFQGLSETSGTGWVTPMNRPRELAERIASIARDAEALLLASRRSLEFAREHTFEKTFRRRIDHLDQIAEFRQNRLKMV